MRGSDYVLSLCTGYLGPQPPLSLSYGYHVMGDRGGWGYPVHLSPIPYQDTTWGMGDPMLSILDVSWYMTGIGEKR